VARSAREPGTIRAEVGERVRRARERRDLSQEAVALASDMSLRHFGNIERGVSNTSIEQLARIAHALGVQPATLIPALDADGRPIG
jgi:transcriptional regulator with XRE-family HTH domain